MNCSDCEYKNSKEYDWRAAYINQKLEGVEKYYKEYDIDNLLKVKEEFEDLHGKELGYQMFKGLILQISLKDTIRKAELKIKYEGEL